MARRQWLQPARKACAVGGNDSLDVSATVDSDDGSPSDKSFSFFFFNFRCRFETSGDEGDFHCQSVKQVVTGVYYHGWARFHRARNEQWRKYFIFA
jgi:hypothetical protein